MRLSLHAACAVIAVLFGAQTARAETAQKASILAHEIEVIPEAEGLPEDDKQEFVCTALAVYYEAKGESLRGQQAVADVILNRKKKGFATSLCGVVWQHHEFSWTARSVKSLIPRSITLWKTSQKAAFDVVFGNVADITHGALYFYNPQRDHPAWGKRLPHVFAEGHHVFCGTLSL